MFNWSVCIWSVVNLIYDVYSSSKSLLWWAAATGGKLAARHLFNFHPYTDESYTNVFTDNETTTPMETHKSVYTQWILPGLSCYSNVIFGTHAMTEITGIYAARSFVRRTATNQWDTRAEGTHTPHAIATAGVTSYTLVYRVIVRAGTKRDSRVDTVL